MSPIFFVPITRELISTENISCIYLIFNIIETHIIAVGDNGLGLLFEGRKVIDYPTAKEGAAVFERWLIYNNLCSLRLDALHNTLYGRLTEIVGVGLHR